jgi:uncharacterized protein (TIGR00255 family)
MEAHFKEQITRRVGELAALLGAGPVDEQRLLAETAAQLVRSTINEEVARLGSHLAALRTLLHSDDAPGRRIDFLCQEINREINTIGSKNQTLEVAAAVVTAKNALENIREQARNVE